MTGKRILQLCHKVPFPPVDGGSIAMHQMTEFFLKHGFNTKVVALNTSGKDFSQQKLPEDYRIRTGFEAQDVNTRINPWKALFHLFSGKSYNVTRFHSKDMFKRLSGILEKEPWDLIQLEGLYLTPYIPLIREKSRAAIIYRAHNIEHIIWKGLASSAKNPLLKSYLSLLASRLEKYELNVVRQIDALMAIGPSDLDFFKSNGFKGHSALVPVMIQEPLEGFLLPAPVPGTVFHIGAMDWRPNQEGMLWFLREVWPKVLENAPEMKLILAGKSMPASFRRYSGAKNITVLGDVPSASQFMADKQIMVVPLLSGSGMRVKIIEGLALGKTIVSTYLGAEGIGCRNNEHIILTDHPKEMAAAIVKCYRNPLWAKAIAEKGSNFVKQHYHPDRIHLNLMDFFNKVCNG